MIERQINNPNYFFINYVSILIYVLPIIQLYVSSTTYTVVEREIGIGGTRNDEVLC